VRDARWLIAVWLCFLVRGVFYCMTLPLWEGFDEYSHFSYVQHVARGKRLIGLETRATREVEQSIELAPMAWTLRHDAPPHETYESYWKLPAAERWHRERALGELRPSAGDALAALASESQQPPLSYWLMAALYKRLGDNLPVQVLALRLLNLVLASAVVPAAWMAARRVFPDAGRALPLAIAAAVALFPELMFDGARVTNSALSLGLYSALSALNLEVVDGGRRAALWMGAVIGLGLLTKGFFLCAVPLMLGLLGWAMWKRGLPRRFAAGSVAVAVAIPGWWYLQNLRTSGGISTTIQDAALKHMPMSERLRHIVDVNWFTAIDSTFFSHIWFGGWSFLQVRAWIYHAFAALALLAVVGLALAWRRRNPARRYLVVLAALYMLFCGGIAYHVLLTYLANAISSSAGWYLCAVLVPEMILLATGLRVFTGGAVAGLAPAFALLDLYGMLFVALPYYSGVIAHRPNGMLEAFHFSRLGEIGMGGVFRRLAVNHPYGPAVIAVAGCLYIAATIALAVVPVISQTLPPRAKRISAA
jgi:hypothetical protein